MHNKQLEFSFLHDFPSVRDGIREIFGVSKNQLKRHKFKRAFLDIEAKKGMKCFVPLSLANYGEIYPCYTGKEVPIIISEDCYVLAISKPVKIHSHPLTYREGNNLLSFLCEQRKYKELTVNPKGHDRGLLYRLDYETSGLILYAKSQKLYDQARSDLDLLVKCKTYLAVVQGNSLLDGELVNVMSYRGEKSKMAYGPSPGEGERVTCSVQTLAYNQKEDCSLVRLQLHQGRRHQLRFQLSQAGHPILGDTLYGGDEKERLFLHSYEYQLVIENKRWSYRDKNFGLFAQLFDLNSHL